MGKGLTEVRSNLKDSKFKNNGRKTIFKMVQSMLKATIQNRSWVSINFGKQ